MGWNKQKARIHKPEKQCTNKIEPVAGNYYPVNTMIAVQDKQAATKTTTNQQHQKQTKNTHTHTHTHTHKNLTTKNITNNKNKQTIKKQQQKRPNKKNN